MSSNGNIFPITGLLWGNTPGTGGFPSRRPVTRSFDVLFDLCHEQTTEQTVETAVVFETLSRSLLRHCNDPRNINISVWSKRNGFSKGRLWSQIIDRLRACSMSHYILKIYLALLRHTFPETTFHGLTFTDPYCHGAMTSRPFLLWPAVDVVTCAI